ATLRGESPRSGPAHTWWSTCRGASLVAMHRDVPAAGWRTLQVLEQLHLGRTDLEGTEGVTAEELRHVALPASRRRGLRQGDHDEPLHGCVGGARDQLATRDASPPCSTSRAASSASITSYAAP